MLFTKLGLDPGETIVLEVRRHWFVFLWNIILAIFFAVLPPIIFAIAVAALPIPEELAAFIGNYFSVLLFAYSIWLLFVWLVLFIQWTNYYLDVWHITQKRIIHVNQKGIFHREVSNLRFDKIQDISIEVRGFLQTFFNYGNLQVQTAAEDSSSFYMQHASKPEEVRRIIFSRHNVESEYGHGPQTPPQTSSRTPSSSPGNPSGRSRTDNHASPNDQPL